MEERNKKGIGENIWGRKWTVISALLIAFTGIMIFYFDRGDRLLDTRKIILLIDEGGKSASGDEKYMVEFWTSRTRERKYKLGSKELILFGFAPSEGLRFLKLDDKYFLIEKKDTFELVETKEFLPLQPKTR